MFFATVYTVQGLAEPEAGLATQPIFFLLKDEMGLSASETATFLALMLYDLIGLSWLIAVSAAATAACWLLVPWMPIPGPPTGSSVRASTASTAPTPPR